MTQPPEGPQDRVKRRRLRGACDECRRRKAKCDSAKMPGKICSACIALKIECRHDFSDRVKPTIEYTQSLEEKIAKFEAYFRRTRPGEDIDQIINETLPEPQPSNAYRSDLAFLGSTRDDASESSEDDSDGVNDDVEVANLLSGLSINYDRKFFGQSSAFSFAKTAAFVRPSGADGAASEGTHDYRRPFFWQTTPWESDYATSQETPYVYPEQDLLLSLVALYFEKTNSLIPILHQPTFMKLVLSGQHFSDPSFGMTVLLVCALGSRYSDDPRIYLPNDLLGMSAGWRYFSQIPTYRRRMLYRSSTVYDIQYYALAALYLNGCSNPNAAWHVLGIGLRYAVEKGAHRRKGWQGQPPNAEDELQKRAFWTIVCLDRIISSFVGRPYGYPHELIDLEHPVECDDEYWDTEDPAQAFRQPPGKPCTITAFVHFIKLCDILGFATRMLYSSKECKQAAGTFGREGEEKIVRELDSSLNKWKDSLPDHLIWSPQRQDPVFFHQSANIYALYHYIQIQIHRPFLTKKSSLTYASLAMCTTAARSCSRILEAAVTRGLRVTPSVKSAIFTAGLFIIFALRNSHLSGSSRDVQEDTQSLQRCINVLKECEKKKWHSAGRLGDMLMEAGSITRYEPSGTRKRRRQSFDTDTPSQGPEPIPLMPAEDYAFSDNSSASSIMDAYAMTAPMNNWDLHRLLLMDAAHPQTNPAEGNVDLFSNGFGDVPFGSAMPRATTSAPFHGQLPDENDIFSWWSDTATAFRSFEEWESHIATGGQAI